jgi:hypothetical protein
MFKNVQECSNLCRYKYPEYLQCDASGEVERAFPGNLLHIHCPRIQALGCLPLCFTRTSIRLNPSSNLSPGRVHFRCPLLFPVNYGVKTTAKAHNQTQTTQNPYSEDERTLTLSPSSEAVFCGLRSCSRYLYRDPRLGPRRRYC